MAQNEKDITDGIIELVDIVEQPENKNPAAKKIDFDSQLSDLLGKGKAITLNDSPELEELLSGLGDESNAHDTPSATDPDDAPHTADRTSPVANDATPHEARRSPMDDVDDFIDQLDVPPSDNKAKTPPAGEPKPEVEDLDSLLDSLFSSPAAGQIGALEQEKPATPPAASPKKPLPAPETPRLNADEIDALFNPPAEEPVAPKTPAPKTPAPEASAPEVPAPKAAPKASEKAPSPQDDLPDLDSLLAEIMPDKPTPPDAEPEAQRPPVQRDVPTPDAEPALPELDDLPDLPVFPDLPEQDALPEVAGAPAPAEQEPVHKDMDRATHSGDAPQGAVDSVEKLTQRDIAAGECNEPYGYREQRDILPQNADVEHGSSQPSALDALTPLPTPEAQDAPSAEAIRQKDAADIAAILDEVDETMPIFENAPFRASTDNAEAEQTLAEQDRPEPDPLHAPSLDSAAMADAQLAQASAVTTEIPSVMPSALSAPPPPAGSDTATFPELTGALDERLARLESGLHSLNQRIATLEEQITITPDTQAEAAATATLPAADPSLPACEDTALPPPVAQIPAQNLDDLLTEGNALCEQLKSLVRSLIAAELPEPRADSPDLSAEALRNADALVAFEDRLRALENQHRTEAEDTSDPNALALAALQERLTNLEDLLAADNADEEELPTADPHAEALIALEDRLSALESQHRAEAEDTADPNALALAALQERLTNLEDQLAADSADKEELPTADPHAEALVALEERLALLEARPEPEPLPVPESPDSASIAEDVLALVRVDLEKAEAAPRADAHVLTDLQKRLEELEARPLPQLTLPDLPDADSIKQDVMKLVRVDLDKIAAESAARVLREEILALLSQGK